MKINPPKNPSHDFFGDIDGSILCFPNLTPIKKANESKHHDNIRMINIIKGSIK